MMSVQVLLNTAQYICLLTLLLSSNSLEAGRPGLPPLRMHCGPVQHFQDAGFWSVIAAEFGEGDIMERFGFQQLLISSHQRRG